MKINIKLFRKNAKMPVKSHEGDACWDLTVSAIKKKSLFKVHYLLGIGMDLPPNNSASIFARSSVHKRFMWLSNGVGVVDNPYKGEWQAVFYKIPFISKPYKVGERCCQFTFMGNWIDEGFNVVKELEDSSRGEGGYGSTGT